VVQIDRRTQKIRDAQGVREKFGVDPERIADFLALVGDSADGYPGIAGIGRATAARLVGRFGALEQFPESVLDGERREQALLSKRLATLRTDAPLFSDVEQLRWRGAGARFAEYAAQLDDARLLPRSQKAAAVSADQL